jgi:Fe-S cluster biogenesis protein NfuA
MEEVHPDWNSLSHDEKLARIRAVIETDVAPQLGADGGGIDVIDLVHENEVSIMYRGACAHCPMASFGTLGFIQHVLTTKVHSSLVVVPSFPEPSFEIPTNEKNEDSWQGH